jgi:hypothetical protein
MTADTANDQDAVIASTLAMLPVRRSEPPRLPTAADDAFSGRVYWSCAVHAVDYTENATGQLSANLR